MTLFTMCLWKQSTYFSLSCHSLLFVFGVVCKRPVHSVDMQILCWQERTRTHNREPTIKARVLTGTWREWRQTSVISIDKLQSIMNTGQVRPRFWPMAQDCPVGNGMMELFLPVSRNTAFSFVKNISIVEISQDTAVFACNPSRKSNELCVNV